MIEVDRKTFLAVCRASERIASTSGPKRARMPWISDALVKDTMPKDGKARVGAGFGGGDEELTFVRWDWEDAKGRTRSGYTIIPRTRLHAIEQACS